VKDARLAIRLTPEDAQHLRRWALLDPDQRGLGAVVRRLIREEVERERRSEQHGGSGIGNLAVDVD